MTARLEPRLDQAEKILGKTRLGERALEELQADPERVTRRFDVEVALAGGRTIAMSIDVVDVRLSKLLHRAALGVDAASFIPVIPFLGLAVRGGAMITAWASSVVARSVGNHEVADALGGAARKQAVLLGFRLTPIPGTTMGSGIVAAVANGQHLAELRLAPAVGSVVGMREVSGSPTTSMAASSTASANEREA